jgi:hypothetical protein
MMLKWLAVGIILLFIGIAVAPVMNANDDVISFKTFSIPKREETVSITVLEYKPDGTIEKSVVKMSREQVKNYKSELKGIKDLDSRLSLYKKYKLIPENVTDETLRKGMEEKALRIQPEIEKIQSKLSHWKSDDSVFKKNFHCKVGGLFGDGLRVLGGSSSITCFINGLIYEFFRDKWDFIPSIDLFQFQIDLVGLLNASEGDLPDFSVWGFFCSYFLLGFVGFFILDPPFPIIFLTIPMYTEFIGYAVACYCFFGFSIGDIVP